MNRDRMGSTLGFGLSTDGARPERTGLVRAINEQVVLEAILNEGTVTRAGLARHTGLSKPTISSVVQSLEDCGLVQPDGSTRGERGRPATVYSVNGLAGHTFAVDLGGTKLRAAVTDLFGDVVAAESIPTPHTDAESLITALVSLYEKLTSRAGTEPAGIAAACIGLPGVVKFARGEVESAFNLPELGHLNIVDEFEGRTGVPVVVENDVNLAAVGERWKGWARNTENFVAISIGTGIGMGIVIGGDLYRGVRGAAGEIGFFPVGGDPFDTRSLDHGGPLESAVASIGIRQRLGSLLADYPESTLDGAASVRDVFEAAAEDDPLATALVDEEARLISLAIAGVTAIVDPELVVLGGGIGSNPLLLGPVRALVSGLVPNPPRIETSALEEMASLHGAVAIALHKVRETLLGSLDQMSVEPP